MLKFFEVTNFKNFKNTISIDFSNIRDYKFNSFCIANNLISKGIIYGQNSVGKSNLGLAIFDIVSHLSSKNVTPNLYDYYLNADNKQNFAEFRYVFQFENDIVDYVYRKNEKHTLLYEKIVINDFTFYEFDYEKLIGDFDTPIKDFITNFGWDFDDMDCILKYYTSNTVLYDSNPSKQMIKFINNMLWFRSLNENRYIGFKNKSDDYFDFIFEEDNLREFEELLHNSGIVENLTILTDRDEKKRLYIDTNRPLPFFSVASNGTKALYNFFYWYKTAKDASFIFIDEFDAYYHYELAESIVLILEKLSNTQILLTSHNTNLLTNKIMRPDCYFILTKTKLTSFADATSRELREGHNLEKLYMSGEFNDY